MGGVLLGLLVLLGAVLALASGLTWNRLGHWAGELCLILGVCVAAAGAGGIQHAVTVLDDRVSILERRFGQMLQQTRSPTGRGPLPPGLGTPDRHGRGQQPEPGRAAAASAVSSWLRLRAWAVALLLAGILLTGIW
jgi:hypothetical protein